MIKKVFTMLLLALVSTSVHAKGQDTTCQDRPLYKLSLSAFPEGSQEFVVEIGDKNGNLTKAPILDGKPGEYSWEVYRLTSDPKNKTFDIEHIGQGFLVTRSQIVVRLVKERLALSSNSDALQYHPQNPRSLLFVTKGEKSLAKADFEPAFTPNRKDAASQKAAKKIQFAAFPVKTGLKSFAIPKEGATNVNQPSSSDQTRRELCNCIDWTGFNCCGGSCRANNIGECTVGTNPATRCKSQCAAGDNFCSCVNINEWPF